LRVVDRGHEHCIGSTEALKFVTLRSLAHPRPLGHRLIVCCLAARLAIPSSRLPAAAQLQQRCCGGQAVCCQHDATILFSRHFVRSANVGVAAATVAKTMLSPLRGPLVAYRVSRWLLVSDGAAPDETARRSSSRSSGFAMPATCCSDPGPECLVSSAGTCKQVTAESRIESLVWMETCSC